MQNAKNAEGNFRILKALTEDMGRNVGARYAELKLSSAVENVKYQDK